MQKQFDVIILGAGAAGMMAAATAGKRGKSVLLLDHAKKIGEKIRISGGGRCNFTNIDAKPENYLSQNPRFCVSALKRYTQHDFIQLVEQYGIAYHEKTLGQLFCDDKSQQIIDMLLEECRKAKVVVRSHTKIEAVSREDETGLFTVKTGAGSFEASAVIVATGGKPIPKIGATGFGMSLAQQFGHSLIETRPALVPLTFDKVSDLNMKDLSGVSLTARVYCGKKYFDEDLLFTHRGLSGPSILQISSYWREGEALRINMLPNQDLFAELKQLKQDQPKLELHNALSRFLSKRLAVAIVDLKGGSGRLADLADKKLRAIADFVHNWRVTPTGTAGYAKAEVMLGGVNTKELSSKTMESQKTKGLYFIGEVVDVTGHLGGYNFQWAWSSAVAAGSAV